MGNKKKKCYSTSSSSSDDEVLSNVLKKKYNTADPSDLYSQNVHRCEFCEQIFFTKYDILVHNAEHVIIPLENQTYYQCPTCLYHFTSQDELSYHNSKNHNIPNNLPDILQNIVLKKPVVKHEDIATELINESNNEKLQCFVNKEPIICCETTITDLIIATNKKLQSLVNKVPIVRCEKTLTELFQTTNMTLQSLNKLVKKVPNIDCSTSMADLLKTTNETLKSIVDKVPIILCDTTITELLESANVLLENFIKREAVVCCDTTVTQLLKASNTIKIEDTDSNSSFTNQERINIKSRLRFEDDFEEEYENDLISFQPIQDITKSYNGCETNKTDVDKTKQYKGKIILGSKVEKAVPSIHYQDLIESGAYRCKKCSKMFPNRYEAIIHETTHMTCTQRRNPLCYICDRYIAGNYVTRRKHIATKHPDVPKRNYMLSKCKKCGLQYRNFYAHMRNYHLVYFCNICSRRFETKEERTEHYQDHTSGIYHNVGKYERIKEIKVCELCTLFLKNTERLKYVVKDVVCEIGVRQVCSRCAKEFFEVNCVEVKVKHNFEKTDGDWRKKPLTNENRLKIIQKRLKSMNKLARF